MSTGVDEKVSIASFFMPYMLMYEIEESGKMAESKKLVKLEIVVRNFEKERGRMKKYQEKFRKKEGGQK